MLERGRDWWQGRDARERALIATGAAALALALLWAYAWVPLAADRARLVAELPKMRAQAQQLALEAAEVDRLRAATRARGAAPASQAAIEQTLTGAGLRVATVALADGGRVQVNLGVVPFDALVRAIAQLAEQHGLAVETVALKAAGEPGKLRVETLVLQGARNR
jgi:general secretion pathway protein M